VGVLRRDGPVLLLSPWLPPQLALLRANRAVDVGYELVERPAAVPMLVVADCC
jgi:hypothetical protein